MHLLVVGTDGLVGSSVVTEALRRGWSVTGTYRSERPPFALPSFHLDIRNRDRFRLLVRRCDPDAVINCAAMTDVDGCERNPTQAHEVNATAPGRMAEVCRECDLPFVHLSTDYVFDGQADAPYDESATPAPKQAYGRSKLAGERAVTRYHDAPLVVRLSFVYGIHRGKPTERMAGFPAWVCTRLRAGKSVALFVDQRVSPSRAAQTAECLLDLLRERCSGTYHVAARSCVSPYEFGSAIQTRLGVSPTLLERTSMADVDRPAPRPRRTCLAVDRVESRLGRDQPSLREDLDAIDRRFWEGAVGEDTEEA